MSESNKIMVQNLTDGDVIYIDNDGGVSRRIVFKAEQKMPISVDLLDRMTYDTGGSVLLRDYLSVKDQTFREEFGIPEDQVEYDYELKDVIQLLKDNNIDAIADALDFGPLAIKDMIAKEAVELPINNRDLMILISDKTGKNIENMIKNKELINKMNNDTAANSNTNTEGTSRRRVAVSKEDIAKIAQENVARRQAAKEE